MRILQVHNKFPYPPKDGGSIAIWTLAVELANQGHAVTLLTMNTKKHYFDQQNVPESVTSKIKLVTVPVDAPITTMGAISNLLFSRLPYNASRFIDKRFQNTLIDLLKENEYDVIQLEGLYVFTYASSIRKYSNALIALRTHNIEHEIWLRVYANETSAMKKRYLRILTRRLRQFEQSMMNVGDVLIPITHRDGAILNAMGNRLPMHVSQAGLDIHLLKPDRTKIEYPSLFYIGALDWAPNQEGLVWFLEHIWPKLNTEFPDLPFYVAGRNAPKWLNDKLTKPGIKHLGEIEDAYELINTKAVMVVPLFSGSGMRVKIVEGMAFGKTIVTTSIGTEGIDSVHNRNILIADTKEGFYQEIVKAITDFSFFTTIGKNATEFVVKCFDIKNIASDLVKFYENYKK